MANRNLVLQYYHRFEAEALTLIDNVDARMNMFEKALHDTEPGSYSARIFGLENRNVYKSRN